MFLYLTYPQMGVAGFKVFSFSLLKPKQGPSCVDGDGALERGANCADDSCTRSVQEHHRRNWDLGAGCLCCSPQVHFVATQQLDKLKLCKNLA